jgi:hypothetical protein
MIFLSTATKAEWDIKRDELLATPNIDPEIKAVAIGEQATENEDGTGRAFGCYGFNAVQCDWLQAQGYQLNAGDLNGPEWPITPE